VSNGGWKARYKVCLVFVQTKPSVLSDKILEKFNPDNV